MIKILAVLSIFCLHVPVFGTQQNEETEVLVSSTVKQIGFQKDDFAKAEIPLVMIWAGRPHFSNYAAYWTTIQSKCNNNYCVSMVLAKPSQLTANLSLNLAIKNNFDSVLYKTPLVNPDNPIIKQSIGAFPNRPLNLKQALDLILQKIPELIGFPDNLLVYPMRNTDEILIGAHEKKVVGECKSFSNVFVAFARSLGIPARLISGYVLSEFGPQGHQWAEIRIEKKWLPVNPQSLTGDVPPIFIPTGIVNEYSFAKENGDALIEIRANE